MNILKFEILDLKKGDKVVKVDGPEVHVSKLSGEYAVYTMKLDQDNEVIDFDVFAVTSGCGDFDLVKNADYEDLAELWESSNE
ncbi:hypothetical protein P7M07_11150 [Vibrio parahaemolyticus]|nr:hypothetical protein [Vibrio parahaemolyticus]MDG2673569.1 hypothetical protein [Vibrio parahaemolyticus]